MRMLGAVFGFMAVISPARADEIVDVLERSQRLRLEQRVAAPDDERTQRVRATFDRLLSQSQIAPHSVELRVMQGGVQAEAMLGRLLVAGDAVGDLPEGERLVLLAHELSHLMLEHWQALCSVYRKHVPGEVRRDTTDPVAGALGQDADEPSPRQEYRASRPRSALPPPLRAHPGAARARPVPHPMVG